MKGSRPAKVNFLVDTLSDPLEVNKAMRGLRAVVRLGRLAEGVIARLEKDGKFEGRAAWLDRERYGRAYILKYSRFPTMPKVTREDVPGYGPVSFRLAKQAMTPDWDDKSIVFLDVFVQGAVPELVEVSRSRVRKRMSFEDAELVNSLMPEATGRLISGERRVGAVRLTTSGGTLYPEGTSKRSITLHKNVQPISVNRMSAILPAVLCGDVGESDPRTAVYCRSLRRWLVEDGLAERFLSDLRESVVNFKVVKDVMIR